MGIIGRERAIVNGLGKLLRKAALKHHDYSAWVETERGGFFEIKAWVDGEPTGHVVRVTVELDRFEN